MSSRVYRIKVSVTPGTWAVVAVTNSYDDAKRVAVLFWECGSPDTAVEIVADRATVWGPYVKGSRYDPRTTVDN